MIPYRGRLSLRIARVVLAFAGLAVRGFQPDRIAILLGIYALFALALLPELRRKSKWQELTALLVDLAYFGLWCRLAPDSWIAVAALSYLLTSAVVMHELPRTAAVAALALFVSLLMPHPRYLRLAWFTGALGASAIAFALYKRYLKATLSRVLRQNVFIRSRAETSRNAERERIAADFHDGPLQSFVGFQMRLQVIRTLLARGQPDAAAEETDQLQEICNAQASDLRAFARSMRPADETRGFKESLAELMDAFQRDTGLPATLSVDGVPDVVDAAREIVQIVREALHNTYKHSGASRVLVSASQNGSHVQIVVEDNGSGFPFTGSLNLDELDRQHVGPISIKRRVRLLNGDLLIASHPGQGAKVEIRIPA